MARATAAQLAAMTPRIVGAGRENVQGNRIGYAGTV